MSDQNSDFKDEAESAPIYPPGTLMLDRYHHDQPERHVFGLAFHNPVDPQPVGLTAFPGISDTPAREDHVHAGGAGQSVNLWAPYKASKLDISVDSATGTFVDRSLTVVADYDGWIEVLANGAYGGFSTIAGVSCWQTIFTNNVAAPSGGGYSSLGSATGPIPSGTWSPVEDCQLIVNVLAGQSWTFTWRGSWNNGAANFYWRSNITAKLYATAGIPIAKGPQGDTGATGATGSQGPQGPQGNTGAQGPQGVQGPPGNTGPQGPQGDPGPTGATGSQGPAGVGVPAGGAAGTPLIKASSADYDTKWNSGALNMGGFPINALSGPSAGTDAANKTYVDTEILNIQWKQSVKAATTANITLSGNQTIDGVALSTGERCLVKNQTTPAQNGIYIVAVGSWTRATDFNSSNRIVGSVVAVQEGTTNLDSVWVCTTNATITVGTTAIAFSRLAAVPVGGTAGQVLTKVDATDYNAQWATPAVGSAAYAYLGATNTGSMGTAGTYKTVTLGAASPPNTFLNGFTIQSSSSQLRCDIPGKYRAQIQAVFVYSATANYSNARISQYNSSAVLLAQHELTGGGATSPATNSDIGNEAIFDMAANDYLVFEVMNGATANFDTRTTVCVTPVGGAKGDTGPDIAAAQSSYFYGRGLGPTGTITGGSYTLATWTQLLANNIALKTTSQLQVAAAGKYRVAAQATFLLNVAAVSYAIVRVRQFNSAGTQIGTDRQVAGTGSAFNNYTTTHFEGIYDAAAGDYFDVSITASGNSVIDPTQCWCEIVPVGGIKGDVGSSCIARKVGNLSGATLPTFSNVVANMLSVYTVNFTAIAGHLYEIRWTARAVGITTGSYWKYTLDGVDGGVDFYGPSQVNSGSVTTSWEGVIGSFILAPSAGLHTIVVKATSALTPTGTFYADNQCYCMIIDLGVDPGAQ